MQKLGVLSLLLLGCPSTDPPRGPEDLCTRACGSKVTQCTEVECARGCNLSLDRLVEMEGEAVLRCVGERVSKGVPCVDRVWAECATHVGPHLDGGPPAPTPVPFPEDE